VQGVPWFVLTSADGKVLWSREVSVSGWPSTAALDKDVRAALAQAAKPSGSRRNPGGITVKTSSGGVYVHD
jgi:hypothetical protein